MAACPTTRSRCSGRIREAKTESPETVEGETPSPHPAAQIILWAEPRRPHWKSPRLRAIRKRGLRRQECPHKSPWVNQPCPPRWLKIPRLLQAAERGRDGLGPD